MSGPNEAQIAALKLLAKAENGRSKIHAFGYMFDSKPEYERYLELRNLSLAGELRNLRVHPSYELVPELVDSQGAPITALWYTADFEYEEPCEPAGWARVTEEVKGPPRYEWHRTSRGKIGKHKAFDGYRGPDYIMRVNLFRRRYPMRLFREVRMGK